MKPHNLKGECPTCNIDVKPTDRVMWSSGSVYHRACFEIRLQPPGSPVKSDAFETSRGEAKASPLKDIEKRADEMLDHIIILSSTKQQNDMIKRFYRKEFISLLEGLKEDIRPMLKELMVNPSVENDSGIIALKHMLVSIDKIIKGE